MWWDLPTVTPKNQGIDQDNEPNENFVKLLDEKEVWFNSEANHMDSFTGDD